MRGSMSRTAGRLRSPGEGARQARPTTPGEHNAEGPAPQALPRRARQDEQPGWPRPRPLNPAGGAREPPPPCPPMDQWAPEDVEAHFAFLKNVSALLEENGEYVDVQALTPAQTWVRYGGPDAAP